jgi:replicative DNA helicase
MAERLLEEQEEAFAMLWHETIYESIMELFAEHETISRQQVIDHLEDRRDETTDRIAKAKFRGAIKAIRG